MKSADVQPAQAEPSTPFQRFLNNAKTRNAILANGSLYLGVDSLKEAVKPEDCERAVEDRIYRAYCEAKLTCDLLRPQIAFLQYQQAKMPWQQLRDGGHSTYWVKVVETAYMATSFVYQIEYVRSRADTLGSLVKELEFYRRALHSLRGKTNALTTLNPPKPPTVPSLIDWSSLLPDMTSLGDTPVIRFLIDGLHCLASVWFIEAISTGWQQACEFCSFLGDTRLIRDLLTYWNWVRLYLVWGVDPYGLTEAATQIPPLDHFGSRKRAMHRLHSPWLVSLLGATSFIGYLIRGGFECYFFLRHCFAPTGDERSLQDFWQRCALEMAQRWEVIANDLVWAWVNILTVFLLIDALSPLLGALGGILTIVLMMFDVGVASRKMRLAEQAHQADQQALRLAISGLEQILLEKQDDDELRLNLRIKQETLRQLQIDWYFEKQKLDLGYWAPFAFVIAIIFIFAPVFPVIIPALTMSAALLNQMVFWGSLASVLITASETALMYGVDKECCEVTLDAIEQKRNYIQRMSDDKVKLIPKPHNDYLIALKSQQNRLWWYFTGRQLYSVITQLAFPVIVLTCMMALPTPWMIIVITLVALIIAAVSLHLDSLEPVIKAQADVDDAWNEQPTPALDSLPEATLSNKEKVVCDNNPIADFDDEEIDSYCTISRWTSYCASFFSSAKLLSTLPDSSDRCVSTPLSQFMVVPAG